MRSVKPVLANCWRQGACRSSPCWHPSWLKSMHWKRVTACWSMRMCCGISMKETIPDSSDALFPASRHNDAFPTTKMRLFMSRGNGNSESDQIKLSQLLSHQYLCESLTVSEVQTLLDYLTFLEFDKSANLSDIGDIGDALYFVIQGEITLTFDDHGQENEIVRAGPGEMLGEMSFFDKQPRSVRLV